jgi:hypothetical protein
MITLERLEEAQKLLGQLSTTTVALERIQEALTLLQGSNQLIAWITLKEAQPAKGLEVVMPNLESDDRQALYDLYQRQVARLTGTKEVLIAQLNGLGVDPTRS